MTERNRKKDRENTGKMKKLCRFGLVCFMMLVLSACGSGAGGDDAEIQMVEVEPIEASEKTEGAAEKSPEDGRPEKQKAESPEDRQPGEQKAEMSADEALNSSPEADENADEPENGSGVEASGGVPGAENTGTAETAGQETGADPWVGEYNDYDVNEPNLEIQKNADGSYEINIGVFRLLSINDGHGVLTEKGMEFTTRVLTGEETTGVITLDGDIATVTFDPGWSGFDTVYSYRYYKTSDTPDMERFEY